MRPPMQKTALQQNEANRLQQHHHQQQQLQLQQQQLQQQQQHQLQSVHLIQPHKHLQQQQQLALQTTTAATTNVLGSNNINDLQQHNADSTITTAVVTAATAAAAAAAVHKSKLEQRELLVENHLNNACFAQVHHHQQHHHHHPQQTTAQLLHHQQQLAPITAARKTTACSTATPAQPVYYNTDYYQPAIQRQQRPTTLLNRRSNIDDNCSSVKLLDLSTSPPTHHQDSDARFRTTATSDVLLHNRQQAPQPQPPPFSNNSNSNCNTTTASNNSHQQQQQQQQRFSYTSQYSRSSSSDDSSSLSLSTACGSLGGVGGIGGIGSGFVSASGGVGGAGARNSGAYNTGSNYSSYNNTFDDAAENFIINFPADTTPTQPLPSAATAPSTTSSSGCSTTTTATNSSEYYNFCLPLSETEPLLTNIEATVKDKQRSIYLNKNSASLIFTKKDLSQTAAVAGTATASPTTYQQHFKLQSKSNNNFNGPTSTTALPATTPSTTSPAATVRRVPPPPFGHSTLRSFSEENYKRKPTKHLPATYHQQHRRSLQLNYNNNLVTTSTCGSIANNNHCCSAGGGNSNNSISSSSSGSCSSSNSRHSAGAGSSKSNSAVLHKTHHNNHNYQQHQQQQVQQQKLHHHQQQQQQHHQQQHSAYNNPCSLTNNTATATRKQYAYSWYAPVYSALEEELEHDSRDSSPIHNLANTKKQNIHQYHHRTHDLNSSLTAVATDNEREALLETRNNINIQTHLQPVNPLKRDALTKQLNPSKLALQHSRNSSGKGSLQASAKGISLNGGGGGGDIAAVEGFANYDLEGPHAGSLGLAGGPQPRRIRFGNFLKSLVGLRPSVTQRNAVGETLPTSGGMGEGENSGGHVGSGGGVGGQIPSSPEITITRTPSEQNMVVMRDPAGRQDYDVVYSSREKLANSHGDRGILTGGSTSSLNVMQQKLWNIMRREGSAISLHQEKSQSIVHYTGLRKCETVIALTRQSSSPCSPTMVACGGAGGGLTCKSQQRLSHTGSGIFSASGVEQIRPLNRLRNSVSSMNNTCSRCSSLLSLAASSSRFSLNNAANPHPHHQHQHHHPHQHQNQQQQQQMTHFSQYQHQRNPSNVSSSNISSIYSHSRDGSVEAGLHFAAKRNSRTSSSNISAALGYPRNSSSAASSRTPSMTSPTTATTASTIKLSTPPTENSLTLPTPHTLALPTHTPSSPASPSTAAREDIRFPMETKSLSAPLTVTSHLKMLTMKKETTKLEHHGNGHHAVEASNINGDAAVADDNGDGNDDTAAIRAGSNVIDGVSNNNKFSSSVTTSLASAPTNVTPSTSTVNGAAAASASASTSACTPDSIMATILQCNEAANGGMGDTNTVASTVVATRPFEMFTCKLCLIDVEDASNSTVLHQCGCQFCTECMKAYVEFEISEGAYEISCPDAQCPEQGVMTIPEIAMLTTNNLMKKHHRYRLNREIELDKTRTWCPRAGCETVCLIGSTISAQTDAAPSTSSSAAAASTNATTTTMSPSSSSVGGGGGGGVAGGDVPTSNNSPLLCAVQCPSCKDEFCSACKKTWHPNITCEEHSRRLAADGQDDIGIPFDNDLIKCCPMCAVPIEKDEGCAQMMCKRCKHVFCWYCLASLDDDFLLRHYDKGPCKNKLGHSRASVVWHRAQVIGIFAGFGILLLVASPLLLLAAPCIICCKCRSCSGSKIDEGDGDMDEATALQSLN